MCLVAWTSNAAFCHTFSKNEFPTQSALYHSRSRITSNTRDLYRVVTTRVWLVYDSCMTRVWIAYCFSSAAPPFSDIFKKFQSKSLAKRGHIVAATLCPARVPVRGKTLQHCYVPRGHTECFWRFSDTFYVSRTQMLRSWQDEPIFGNMITSALLPPQCVLALPTPRLRSSPVRWLLTIFASCTIRPMCTWVVHLFRDTWRAIVRVEEDFHSYDTRWKDIIRIKKLSSNCGLQTSQNRL